MSKNTDDAERKPQGVLLADIQQAFGTFENLKDAFTKKAKTLFGSGDNWNIIIIVNDYPSSSQQPC